jgi:hypothetical protein
MTHYRSSLEQRRAEQARRDVLASGEVESRQRVAITGRRRDVNGTGRIGAGKGDEGQTAGLAGTGPGAGGLQGGSVRVG